MERRFSTVDVHLESRADGGIPSIVGYAAVFYRADDPGTELELFPGYIERILPTAFNRAIAEGDDAAGKFNHDDSQPPLGRVSSKTLTLTTDKTGLKYRIDPPDTPFARSIVASIERRDLRGSSFAFTVRGFERTELDDGTVIRGIADVQLYDVGPVTHPAYEATSTGVRSLSISESKSLREELAAYRQIQKRLAELRETKR